MKIIPQRGLPFQPMTRKPHVLHYNYTDITPYLLLGFGCLFYVVFRSDSGRVADIGERLSYPLAGKRLGKPMLSTSQGRHCRVLPATALALHKEANSQYQLTLQTYKNLAARKKRKKREESSRKLSYQATMVQCQSHDDRATSFAHQLRQKTNDVH